MNLAYTGFGANQVTFDVQGTPQPTFTQVANTCSTIISSLAAAAAVLGFASAVTGVAAIFQPEFAVPAVGFGLGAFALGTTGAIIGGFGPTGCSPFLPNSNPPAQQSLSSIPDGFGVGGSGSAQMDFTFASQ